MRVPVSPLEAVALLLGASLIFVLTRGLLRLMPDVWILINALAQPNR